MVEIASRLRVRTLRDANAGAEHTPVGLAQSFGPPSDIRNGPPLPSSLRSGSSGGYDPLKVPSSCLYILLCNMGFLLPNYLKF